MYTFFANSQPDVHFSPMHSANVVQQASTAGVMFAVAGTVACLGTLDALQPGDTIAIGTTHAEAALPV